MKMTTPVKPHIVIIGGGAGGLELAVRLARTARAEQSARITLIDRRPTHIWKPRLHEIATGLLVASDEEISFAAQAAQHGFEFVLGDLAGLDAEKRVIDVSSVPYPDGKIGQADDSLLPARSIAYDYAVLAIGSTVNDFDTPGVLEHCYTLDTPEQAEQLNRAFLALAARVKAGAAEKMRVVVIGAGTTGVELAAELRSAGEHLASYRSLLDIGQLEIEIIEMADRPLASGAADSSDYARKMLERHRIIMRFGARVSAVTAGKVQLSDGGTVPADLIVWASGIRGQTVASSIAGLKVERGGRIRVDPTLRAVTEKGPGLSTLFCMGDCAACFEEGATHPVAATAQAAHQQAALLARSLSGHVADAPLLAFRYRYQGTLVSLGAGRAVGDVPYGKGSSSIRIAGLGAKLAYDALYRSHFATIIGWRRTLALSVSGWFRRSASPSVKLHW